MKKTNNIFLFHLRSYNDTDHITPVIDYFIKKKERVHVLYLSEFVIILKYECILLYNVPTWSSELGMPGRPVPGKEIS